VISNFDHIKHNAGGIVDVVISVSSTGPEVSVVPRKQLGGSRGEILMMFAGSSTASAQIAERVQEGVDEVKQHMYVRSFKPSNVE
jgi:hypothetical protein